MGAPRDGDDGEFDSKAMSHTHARYTVHAPCALVFVPVRTNPAPVCVAGLRPCDRWCLTIVCSDWRQQRSESACFSAGAGEEEEPRAAERRPSPPFLPPACDSPLNLPPLQSLISGHMVAEKASLTAGGDSCVQTKLPGPPTSPGEKMKRKTVTKVSFKEPVRVRVSGSPADRSVWAFSLESHHRRCGEDTQFIFKRYLYEKSKLPLIKK